MEALTPPARLQRRRALGVAVLMAGAAALAQWRQPTRRAQQQSGRLPLAKVFPASFDGWQAEADAPDLVRPVDAQGKVFGLYDDLVERVYQSADGHRVMVSAAYGEEQSPRLQVHKPELCYPTAGFTLSGVSAARMPVAGAPIAVTRMRAAMLDRHEAVTYWMVLGDEVQSDDQAFQRRQRAFGQRGVVLDGMLVRVSSIDRDSERAWRVHTDFSNALARALAPAERARVFGQLPAAAS